MAPSASTASTAEASPKVWLITGCSSGLGEAIALAARKSGDYVVATARNPDTLGNLRQHGCDALALDVTADDAAIQQVVKAAHELHGRIDVLVNNAGIFWLDLVEEASTQDVFSMFNTNVFGLLKVTRATLPYMRAQRSGVIANIGSAAGRVAFASGGIYSATKFAVASLSQALRIELAPFNIDVVALELGAFRTRGFKAMQGLDTTIEDYQSAINELREFMSSIHDGSDPDKAAELIVETLTGTGRAAGRKLPSRLALGGNVFDMINSVLETDRKEFDDWKDYTNPEIFAFDTGVAQ